MYADPERHPASGHAEADALAQRALQRFGQHVAPLLVAAPHAPRVALQLTILDQLRDRRLGREVALAIDLVAQQRHAVDQGLRRHRVADT